MRIHDIATTVSAVIAASAAVFAAAPAHAQPVELVGGLTSILLDTETLAVEAGLKVTEVGPRVITPGNLGPDSIGFVITPPVAGTLPTTFSYTFGDFLDTFAGEINHRGIIVFNESLAIGNLRIYHDGGFKVEDTFGVFGTIFDLEIASLSPEFSTFEATGTLRISANFAAELLALGLASHDVTGVAVGTAFVQGFNIPSPAPAALLLLAGLLGFARRVR